MSHVHTPDCYANGCKFGGAMGARRPVRTPLGQLDPVLVTAEFQKLQKEIAWLREERDRYRDALERLSRLGNGNLPGNSDGNVIAQEALKNEI